MNFEKVDLAEVIEVIAVAVLREADLAAADQALADVRVLVADQVAEIEVR
ncbi:MAG: hypothetical protein WCO10_02775 [bacterium]